MSKLVILIVLIISSCAPHDDRRIGRVAGDAGITTAVNAAFVKDELVSALDVNVDTYKQIVTLTGHVESQRARERAIVLARSTKGVRNVVADKLYILP